MNTTHCTNIQSLFSPAVDSRLEPGEKMMFDHHLKGCSDCLSEFEQYERLFAAVAMISVSTMTGPVPFPDSVKSFRGASQPSMPWWGRFGSTAAAAALLVVVGFGAFHAGRKEDDAAKPDETAKAEFVQPSAPVAHNLKGLFHDIEATPELLEVALQHPSRDVQKIIVIYLEDEIDQFQKVMAYDHHNLGSLEVPVQKIFAGLSARYSDMAHVVLNSKNPAQGLRRAKSMWRTDSKMQSQCNELGLLVRPFTAGENQGRYAANLDPMVRGLSSAMNSWVQGNTKIGLSQLRSVKHHLLNEGSNVYQLYRATENRLKKDRFGGSFVFWDSKDGPNTLTLTPQQTRALPHRMSFQIKITPNPGDGRGISKPQLKTWFGVTKGQGLIQMNDVQEDGSQTLRLRKKLKPLKRIKVRSKVL